MADCDGTVVATIRPLTKEEIDARLAQVVAELTFDADESGGAPRWITAAELVRRLRPFIVYN